MLFHLLNRFHQELLSLMYCKNTENSNGQMKKK